MTEQTLKPCPFCGGKAALKEDRDTTALAIQRFFVTCDQLVPGRLPRRKCFAAMGENYDRDGMPDHMYSSADQAIAAWNARAEPMSLERAREIVAQLAPPKVLGSLALKTFEPHELEAIARLMREKS